MFSAAANCHLGAISRCFHCRSITRRLHAMVVFETGSVPVSCTSDRAAVSFVLIKSATQASVSVKSRAKADSIFLRRRSRQDLFTRLRTAVFSEEKSSVLEFFLLFRVDLIRSSPRRVQDGLISVCQISVRVLNESAFVVQDVSANSAIPSTDQAAVRAAD